MTKYLVHANGIDQAGDWGMMPHGWGMMGGGWFGGWLMVVIGILTILFLVVLIRWLWIKGNQERDEKGS